MGALPGGCTCPKCTNISIFPQISQIFTPTEFTEHTEQTGREYSPTDFRFTQIFTPTEFTEFTEQTDREYSPTDFTDLHRYLLLQNSRNTQNRLTENILPQIYTDIYSHRIHGIHRTFCLYLCKSVKSVGVSFQ